MVALMTVDRNRQYYIATRGCTTPATVTRTRWKQGEDKDAEATRETSEFDRPHVVSFFHRTANKIDIHNRYRHEILGLTNTWKTKRWDMRVNMAILGMIFIDTFLVW